MSKKPYNQPEYWQSFVKTENPSQWVAGLEEQLKQATHYVGIHPSDKAIELRGCLTTNSF